MAESPFLKALAARSGLFLRAGVLAVLFAIAVTMILPARWESTAVLLPPDRRSDDFRYMDGGSGRSSTLKRLLRSFRPRDDAHPLDVWEAIVDSPETARRLVQQFGLEERWGIDSLERATQRVQEVLEFEDVPYGGVEIRCATEDPQLSAEMANAAAGILQRRMHEMYREDVRWERDFLQEAADLRRESAMRTEERLVAAQLASGRFAEEDQAEEASDSLRKLAVQLADARIDHARLVVDAGRGTAAERQAAARVEELERAASHVAWMAPTEDGQIALEREREELEQAADLLTLLRMRTVEHQATHDTGVRVLDPAVPADEPERPLMISALLALVFVPAPFAGGWWAGRLGRRLPEDVRRPFGPLVRRLRGAADRVSGVGEIIGLALLSTLAGLFFTVQPLALAGVVGVVFLAALAVDLRGGWFFLVLALPWAWDYINERAGFEIQLPTEPGIILLVAAWAYIRLLRPRPLPKSSLMKWTLFMLGWMAATVATSVYLKHSAFQLVSITGFVAAGMMFPLVELRRLEEIERVLRVYIVAGSVLSVYGIIQVVRSPLPFERAAFWMGDGLLDNHGPFATYLGFALGPAYVYLLSGKFTSRQIPVLLAASLMTIATVVSLTRAAWVATAALLLVFAAARARLFLKKITVPLVAAVAILIPVFLNSPAAKQGIQNYWEVSTSLEYASNVERLNRWIAALRMVADRPITGVGPGAYEIAYDDYRSVDFTRERRGTHSELLRAASEMGLPGLFLFGAVVVVFFRTGLRLMRRGSSDRVRTLAAALSAGMFTYAVHGQFNEYFRNPKIAITVWVFAGLLGALDRLDRGRAEGGATARPAGPDG